MESKNTEFVSNYKKIGFTHFNQNDLNSINGDFYKPFIKVVFLPENYVIKIDFKVYKVEQPALFFINSNQYFAIAKATEKPAHLIYYNRDFYCVQIHDAEVACDGLLFNNIFEIPKVNLNLNETILVEQLLNQIKEELYAKDSSSEEMIRVYLKQTIIRATRAWKKQNLATEEIQVPLAEQDFFRNFSRLVEIHFREKHSVADYAELLNLAPKTLSQKLKKLNLENPNEIIKNRILLEAKRLLLFTQLSIKEVAYDLGYDDPAYFNRMFAQKTGTTPAAFKKELKNE